MQQLPKILLAILLLAAGVFRAAAEQPTTPTIPMTPADAPSTASIVHILDKIEGEEHFTIVCFGDSVTEVNWTTRGRLNWVGLLSASLFETGYWSRYTVINSGLSGDSVTTALARLQRDVLRYDPDLVIIGFGMNDWSKFPAEKTQEDLRTVIQSIRERGPASIILQTPQPMFDRDTGAWVEEPKMDATVQAIRELAIQEDIVIVDHYALWKHPDAGFAPVEVSYDLLHPNEHGHLRIFREIAPLLGLRTRLRWME